MFAQHVAKKNVKFHNLKGSQKQVEKILRKPTWFWWNTKKNKKFNSYIFGWLMTSQFIINTNYFSNIK